MKTLTRLEFGVYMPLHINTFFEVLSSKKITSCYFYYNFCERFHKETKKIKSLLHEEKCISIYINVLMYV